MARVRTDSAVSTGQESEGSVSSAWGDWTHVVEDDAVMSLGGSDENTANNETSANENPTAEVIARTKPGPRDLGGALAGSVCPSADWVASFSSASAVAWSTSSEAHKRMALRSMGSVTSGSRR